MDEYILVDDIIKESAREVYQIHGIKESNKAEIIKVGFMNENIHDIIIYEFTFRENKCYVLMHSIDGAELNDAIDSKELKILSLKIIKKDDREIIIKLFLIIENINDNEITGKYCFKLNGEIIEELCEYPGDDNIIYELISMLSHEKIEYI
jgi:hypothetical protein